MAYSTLQARIERRNVAMRHAADTRRATRDEGMTRQRRRMTRGGAARVKAARGEGAARSDGGMRQSRDEGQRVAKGRRVARGRRVTKARAGGDVNEKERSGQQNEGGKEKKKRTKWLWRAASRL
jgi:hypothetical protein